MVTKTIKKKIINVVLLTIFVSGFLSLVIVAYFSYKNMLLEKKTNLASLVDEQADKIEVYFKESQDASRHLASLEEIVSWVDNPSEEKRIDTFTLLNNLNIAKRYSVVYIMNASGTVTISTDNSLVGNNYGFRDYFKQAINDREYLEMAIGVTTKYPGYYFSSPIKNKNREVVGVVVMKMDTDFLHGVLKENNLMKTGKIMFVDHHGVVLYSNISDRIYKSLGQLDGVTLQRIKETKTFPGVEIVPLQYDLALDSILSNKNKVEVIEINDAEEGEEELLTIAPISGAQFFLVTETDFDEIFSQAINLSILLGLFILLFVLVSIFLISVFISKTLNPLSHLKSMAEKLGQGVYVSENPIKSDDDVEELGDTFITMSKRLKSYYKNLESKVQERTIELEKKNKSLGDAKKATLNVLEDVEEEKNKTFSLLKDLEKFKLALDNASDHIVITDSEGVVLYGNKGVPRITGYTLEESLGKKAGVLWQEPMEQAYYKKLWKTIKNDKKTFESDIKNKRKNGEEYEAHITISPVLNNKNEVEFFVGIERDITHEKEVDRAKTEFVSLASHQLRTPLSSINWYAEMLLAGDGGKLNEEQISFVNEIYTANQRMVELVNSLLNVSRLELGTFAVEPLPTDIIKIAQEVLSELKPVIISKKLKLVFDYDKNIPIISADPKLIRIVFQNLLSNSVKYTPEKGEVKLLLSQDKKNLLVQVIDSGYGIPKNQQDKIFSKLFRADNVREKDTEGTGLGLYIIKSIVDHAGGKISFESEEDKGTSFFVSLPLNGMKKKVGNKSLE